MSRNFQLAVEMLGKPGERDVEGYFSEMGIPAEGKTELLKIPPFIVKGMFLLARINQAVRPTLPYEVPLLPYNMRAGYKFMSEYDTDFSRATIDGDLSKNFSPEDALQRVKCPMLLLWAGAHRHETWGLVGAIDDKDLEQIVSLVDDLQYVKIPGGHEIHMVQPQWYIDEITKFVDGLRDKQAKLNSKGELPKKTTAEANHALPDAQTVTEMMAKIQNMRQLLQGRP